jgi:hypothetical protein
MIACTKRSGDLISTNITGHSDAHLSSQIHEGYKQEDCGPGHPGHKSKDCLGHDSSG